MNGVIDVVAMKQALIAHIAAAVTAAELEVQVAYAWPGKRAERECIHGGLMDWEETGAGLNEDKAVLAVEVHSVVHLPGGTMEEADVRAAELGKVIARAIADDDTLGGQPGVLSARVLGGDLDHGANDDGATSVLTQRIALDCYEA